MTITRSNRRRASRLRSAFVREPSSASIVKFLAINFVGQENLVTFVAPAAKPGDCVEMGIGQEPSRASRRPFGAGKARRAISNMPHSIAIEATRRVGVATLLWVNAKCWNTHALVASSVPKSARPRMFRS